MTAPQPGSSWPAPGQPADWPGRPRVDVPGLEQPAHYCHAIATLDEPGHRQLLVIASEDGALPTLDQLTALADGLDELHGDDAPVGSRAWLRDQLAQRRTELADWETRESTWQRRAEMAEAALRDRSAVDEDGRERERLSLELARTREAHTHQAARAAQLYQEREEQTGRAEAAEAAAHRLRQELGVTRQESAEARADADRYANALTTLEQERDEARGMVLQLGPPAAELREEVEGLRAVVEQTRHERDRARTELADRSARGQAQVDRLVADNDLLRGQVAEARARSREHGDEVMGLRTQIRDLEDQRGELRDALVDLLRQLARRAVGELDAKREAATQRRRARSAVAGAAGALTTTAAAAALAWRHRR